MDQNNELPNVVFENESPIGPSRSFRAPTSKIAGWVIKYSGGLVRGEKQANRVLIGFVAAAIIISLFLTLGGSGSVDNPRDIQILPAVS